jgi:hypothetical protein
MEFLRDIWDAFGEIVDAKTEASKHQKIQGFIWPGGMPIYGPRRPSVFLPEPEEDEEDEEESR